MKNTGLGNRMKQYENVNRIYLTRRMPLMVRVDGQHFHSFTRGFDRPFDMLLMETMWDVAKHACEVIPGCKLAFTQSDEISLLITDYDTIKTEAWFDKNLQKIVSSSAAEVSVAFNKIFRKKVEDFEKQPLTEEMKKRLKTYKKRFDIATFDSRSWTLPKEEVNNYFIWRQQDMTSNSIQMLARVYFSDTEMHKKNCDQLQEMLFNTANINWNNIPTYQKRGACVIKMMDPTKPGIKRPRWMIDREIPIFTQDRSYVERFVYLTENK